MSENPDEKPNHWDSLIDRFLHEETFYHVTPWRGFGIFVLPIFFVWQLLEDGYSFRARVISFAWLLIWVFGASFKTAFSIDLG